MVQSGILGNAKIGTRMETSHITINSEGNNNYLSVLPYVSGQFKVNSKNTLKFSYSRRVIRPSSSNLNPFVSVIDSQTVSHGNINLKPACRDYFQFTYSYRFGKDKLSGTISPQVYYDYKIGIIQKKSRKLLRTPTELKLFRKIFLMAMKQQHLPGNRLVHENKKCHFAEFYLQFQNRKRYKPSESQQRIRTGRQPA